MDAYSWWRKKFPNVLIQKDRSKSG